MKKSKMMKLDKEERPWIYYYNNIPANLEYPNCSMVDKILDTAEKYPNNMAYSYYGTKVAYKNFVQKIKKAARALKSYGVMENDKITICMPNTPEGIIMVYAVNMVGAICNMVHPMSSEKELEYYINEANSKFIIVVDMMFDKIYKLKDNTCLEKIIVAKASEEMRLAKSFFYWLFKARKIKVPKNDNSVLSWDEFILHGKNFDGIYHVKKKAYDPAVILYSGGTTGKPKGIVLANLNFNALALMATNVIKEAKAGATILSILPIFHGFGLGVCIHTPLCVGMGCILIPTFHYKKFGNIIRKNKPNFIVGVPTLYEGLLQSNIGNGDLKSVTAVICGGDNLNKTLKEKLNNFLYEHGSNAKVRVGYGLTEATGAVCLSPEKINNDKIIGVPFPDMYMKIVIPATHEKQEIEKDGEICVSGPLVMMKYLNDDVETNQVLRIHEDGRLWLHTGDIGYMGKDNLFYFSQRLKRIIVSSGYNIYPTYIEEIINTHYAVLTSTVIGIPHPYKGQVVKACVVLKNDFKESLKIENEIRELVKKHVAKYALPVKYEFRKTLPTTLIGKVAFKELEKEEK